MLYIHYANIAWGSAPQTKLNKICSKQKQASQLIFNEDRHTHARIFRYFKCISIKYFSTSDFHAQSKKQKNS